MNLADLENIKKTLNATMPPSDLILIEALSDMEWIAYTHKESEIYCDILLRISADAIIYSTEIDDRIKRNAEMLLCKLHDKIENSGILNNFPELRLYFNRYSEYLLDF